MWRLLVGLLVVGSVGLAGHGAHAQIVEPGICPFSTPVGDWSEDLFVSKPWYEIKAFPVSGLHQSDEWASCTTWHFSPAINGQGLDARLKYRLRDEDGSTHAFAAYSGGGRDKYPRFNMTFHDLAGGPRSMDMKLVAADFDDFALLWGCFEPNLFERKVVTWLLSRQPVLSASAQEAVQSVFKRHDIRAEKLMHTDHYPCDHSATDRDVGDFTVLEDAGDNRSPPLARGYSFDRNRDLSDAASAHSTAHQVAASAAAARAETDGAAAALPSVEAPSEVTGNYVGPDSKQLEDVAFATIPLFAVLLAFVAVCLVVALLTCCAALRVKSAKASRVPVLPFRRQDLPAAGQDAAYGVSVSALSSGVVDYSRFGGLGQGLVQTRKSALSPQPRLHM